MKNKPLDINSAAYFLFPADNQPCQNEYRADYLPYYQCFSQKNIGKP